MRPLDGNNHLRWIAATHPELDLDLIRLPLPSFIAPVAVAEALEPGSFVRWVAQAALRIDERLAAPQALFLGTPFERYDQTHLLSEADPREVRAVAEQEARLRKLELCVLPNVQVEAAADWIDAGFVALASFPDTLIDVDVPSFDAHLATLPAGDRSGIRRNIKKFVRAGHTIERVFDSRSMGGELHRAYRVFFERAKVHWMPYSRAYFDQLAEQGNWVRLFVAFSPEREPVGFVVNFSDKDMMQTGRLGVAPEYHHRDRIYFRLLYYALEDAIAAPEATTLSLEPTGYRTKRHLGARKLPLVNLVLGTGRTWRGLLAAAAPLGRWMLRHLEEPERLDRSF